MKKAKKFYLIGIAGVAMASLAGLLKKKGYDVAGSDQDVYPPMSDMLKSLKIPVSTTYNAFHMKHYKPDIVVVGNAIGRGNPELEYVISIGLPYRSMSDILLDEFISPPTDGKKAIVITGTHGKTTTTALVAWILEEAGLDPTIFVGGFMRNIDSTFKLGSGKYIVIEGDEYDTAFFDKGPKFWHYRPFIGLVNNIELDHVDIFKDIDAYKYAFTRFINLIPPNGLLTVSRENKESYDLSREAKASFHVKTFGVKHGDYIARNIRIDSDWMAFNVFHMKPASSAGRHNLGEFKTKLIGKHNVSNILGAISIAKFLKISDSIIKKALITFKSVKRRAEIIGEKNGIIVIDDYAHHPTAVRETLKALKEKFHTKLRHRLFVVFEPGSASSKRRVFEEKYIRSFGIADVAYIYKPFKPGTLKKEDLFNGKKVVANLKKKGILAKNFDKIDNLLFHMKRDTRLGDVIVIMSCRGFDNLYKLIWDVL